MILEELKTTYRPRMPGFDLVADYEAGIPVYHVHLKIEVLSRQEMPATAEFALKLVNLGINTDQSISQALGLDVRFVRDALTLLDSEQLVKQLHEPASNPGMSFSLTAKGKKELQGNLSTFHTDYLDIQVDALLGRIERYDTRRLLNADELQKRSATLIHVAPGKRPTVSALNSRLNDIRPIFAEEKTSESRVSHAPANQLVEVLEVERPRLLYRAVNVLLFRNQEDGSLVFRVFTGYEPADDYAMVLARREREGARVVPDALLVPAVDVSHSDLLEGVQEHISNVDYLEQQIQAVELQKEELLLTAEPSVEMHTEMSLTDQQPVITGRTKRIQELEKQLQDREIEAAARQAIADTDADARTARIRELDERIKRYQSQQSGSRLLKTPEHRPYLEKALKTAERYVVVVSPWIKPIATDKAVISWIESAVRDNVYVLIGYGIELRPGQSKHDLLDPQVEIEFQRIQAGPGGDKFHYVSFIDTHEKILLCDDTFCVLTSFNWLSYRGDRGFRRETGVYSEDPHLIKQTADSVLPRFGKVFKILPLS